ncbi:MAG TPA: TonB family protein [Steroidobacteraceae bacterium]|jgi:protein TonB|nr:TonB family protein [Steroidobacteraceae bacterium]
MARRALMLREGRAPVWDRLLTMLFLAAMLHGLIILGLTFNASAGNKDSAPGLEVLLVSDELPSADRNPTATYLAQRTQLGSGNTRTPKTPRNRASAVPTPKHSGTPDGDTLAEQHERTGSPDERVLTTTAWNTDVRYLAELGSTGLERNRPLLLDQTPVEPPGPEDEQGPAELRGPQRDELWITPDTRAAALAPYLDAWRRKVERIGTLNFPNAARTTGTKASPLVAVAIDSDGRIQVAEIRRSSGDAELDQAALSTLRLASPFDPFPPELAAQYRVLHFAYEWQFTGGRLGGGTVSTAP